MVPIHLDDNVIGYTIFFPYSLGLGLFGVQPPSEYSEPGTLVVAILPYALSQEQIKVVPRTPETQLRPTLQQGPKNRPIAKYPRYHRATKILGFPEALRKFLSDPAYVRPFAVWPDPESRTTSMKDRQSLETGLLLNILENGQRNASSKSDVRVAFIHIGSLHQIHKFPEFAERRTKSYIQFYTYGTHYDVPPDMWAVREIYPCGALYNNFILAENFTYLFGSRGDHHFHPSRHAQRSNQSPSVDYPDWKASPVGVLYITYFAWSSYADRMWYQRPSSSS